MADYLPNGDEALAAWFNNFQSKFGGYATTLGFVAADASAVLDDYNMFVYLLQTLSTLRPDLEAITAYKEAVRRGPIGSPLGAFPAPGPIVPPPPTVPAGIEPRIRAVVQRIKNHPAYDNSIGEDLGITTPAPATGTTPPKPDGTATALTGGEVRVTFVKGAFQGVYVESQRGAETGWTVLGFDTASPYLDSRPPLAAGQPEVRRYRLRYIQHDAAVGDYSDVMSVTTLL